MTINYEVNDRGVATDITYRVKDEETTVCTTGSVDQETAEEIAEKHNIRKMLEERADEQS